MKRTHSFEIVGLGNFDEYPAKVKDTEYPTTSKDGIALVKKVLQQGVPSEYGWMDVNGKVYTKEEVFYNINGRLVQKVNRTDKVVKHEVIDVKQVNDLLECDTSFLLPQNQTTLMAFKQLVPEGKALKFTYKKSSVGLKWVKALVYSEGDELVMITGNGSKAEAFEMFRRNKQVKQDAMPEQVVVSANEVEPDL